MSAPPFTSPLLTVKFHQPAAPRHQVARPALVARLNKGLAAGRPLTLIAAPAGYGKTTLAAQWTAPLDRPVAWLALDEADDDPLRFCTYFVAAMQRVHPAIGAELLPALLAGQLPPQGVLAATLLNDLEAAHTSNPSGLRRPEGFTAPLVCVLDDFHAVQHPAILGLLQALLAHPSAGLHLCLVTREDPALPLGRLRARAQLNEVRAADLRFDEAEIAAFLRGGMGLALSEADLGRLAARTEGWAAGLQLAGLSLQGRADPAAFVEALSGSHRFILGYLTEEVLARQPAAMQQFLQDTSILVRLSGDLCDAVAGRSDSAELLERLLAANLFIVPLDDEGRWYRYHHLFADLLQHKLRRERPGCLPELHRRASLWHESQDMPAASIEHALAAGDQARAVALLEKYRWRLLTQGHSRALLKWVQSLPEALRNSSPKLNTALVWGQILHGDYRQTGPYLVAAQSALAALPPDSAEARGLRADLLAVQSFLAQAQGQAPEALALAEQARSLAPDDDARLIASTALAFGVACRMVGRFDEATGALQEAMHAAHAVDDHVTATVAVAHLSLLWYPLGHLRRLTLIAELAIERAETVARVAPLMIGSVHAVLGQVYYEWNQVERARAALLHGIRLATLASQPASLIYGKVAMARLCQGEGDLEGAAQHLREAGDVLARGGPGWARLDWAGQQASLLAAQGNLAEAEATLAATGIPAEAPVTYRSDAIHLAWLRWMIAGRHPQALALAGRIVQSAEAGGRNGTLIQALVLGAKAAGGGPEWLDRARQLAAPEGYQRVFIDEAPAEKAAVSQDLIEPLTERELDVLRLLAEGLTYAGIADRLVVSVNTVRYHVKEIYGKLGVNRQAQAAARAREMGLL
jgi:LuxR family maltose regulon positive regulatory protein